MEKLIDNPGSMVSVVRNGDSGVRFIIKTSPMGVKEYWTTIVSPIFEDGSLVKGKKSLVEEIKTFIREDMHNAQELHGQVCTTLAGMGMFGYELTGKFPTEDGPKKFQDFEE